MNFGKSYWDILDMNLRSFILLLHAQNEYRDWKSRIMNTKSIGDFFYGTIFNFYYVAPPPTIMEIRMLRDELSVNK